MVVVWVRLGRKLGEFRRALGALVWVERRRKRNAVLQWKKGGIWVLSALGSLTLSWTIKRQ